MTDRPRLRDGLPPDSRLGEGLRDLRDGLDSVTRSFQRTVEMTYAEPMSLNVGKLPPAAIEVIRVIDLGAQDQPVVGAGGVAHFSWRPQLGGAQITSINGMTAAANGGKRYRFVFRVTLAAAGGS